MVNDWMQSTLGEDAELLTGFPFKSKEYVLDSNGVKLLRGDNIGQGSLCWNGAKLWPLTKVHDVSRYILTAGDVVLAMDRPWIEAGLKFASVATHDLPCLLVQRVARLRGGPRLELSFLRYLIGSKAFTEHVLAVQTGTAVPHISGSQILSFRYQRPPLSEQKRIANILASLDDKIELNQRMSQTLEGIARGIFQSWFVDFGPVRAKADGPAPPGLAPHIADLFPDSFEPSELGEIPKGWFVASLDQIGTFLNGLALQKYPPGLGENLPVVKIAQLRKGSTAGADLADCGIGADYVVKDGDILFSWSGSLECDVWAGGPGALNQHIFKVTSSKYPKWFLYFWIVRHLPEFRRIAAAKATTMGHIQRKHLSEAKVLMPPHGAMERMDQVLSPFLRAIVARKLQSRTLALVRDNLLPKLISGELRVSDAERALAGVV